MTNVTSVIDSTNVTLEWFRPEGRIEYYSLKWWPTKNPRNIIKSKNFTENHYAEEFAFNDNAEHIERIVIGELFPGMEYSFSILTVSYNLESTIAVFTTRTSLYSAIKTNNKI